MSQLISLSRAARLVGVKRGTLQKHIQNGDLSTFEGKIELSELLTVYPETKIENTAMLDRLERIKEDALRKIVREQSTMPNSETFSARAGMLTTELLRARQHVSRYQQIMDQLQSKLVTLKSSLEEHSQDELGEILGWLQTELEEPLPALSVPERMLAREAVLRIIAANVRTVPSGHEFFVEGEESILESGLRNGLALNYGCNDGSCGICRGKVVSGEARKIHTHGYNLSSDEIEQGYILTCCNTAVTDLTLEVFEASTSADLPFKEISAIVKSVKKPSEQVAILQLSMGKEHRLRFLSGQKVNLGIGDLQLSSYSIASCPCDDRTLSFHILNDPSIAFSDYVHRQIQSGDIVKISGPSGNFGLIKDSPRSIIFIAGDTGFAPIKSLIEHALAIDDAETINLYWVVAESAGLYSHNLCRSWDDALDNFNYTPWTISNSDAVPLTRKESIIKLAQTVVNAHPRLQDYDVYLAAPRDMNDLLIEQFTTNGLPMNQLRTEPLRG